MDTNINVPCPHLLFLTLARDRAMTTVTHVSIVQTLVGIDQGRSKEGWENKK